MINKIQSWLNSNAKIKRRVHHLLINPVRTRPRAWLRLLMFLYTKRGAGSVICSSVRKDIVPFNKFSIGRYSVIESFSTINNMVGEVKIGERSRVGIANTIIGPAEIGNNVMLAQNIVVSGMDHNYINTEIPISLQGVTVSKVVICDDSWIGANSVITKGITIGRHSIVAAGSVVKRDVDDFTIVAGNPAKPIKKYNFELSQWEKI